MNTADYLLEHGSPKQVALISGKNQYSYQDLRSSAERVAGELTQVGVCPGDRVGLLGNNSLFWVASYLAILKIGAIAVPFATTLPADEISRIQEFVQCKATCADRRMARSYSAILKDSDIFDDILQAEGPHLWPAAETISNLDADAALMFTSGTTARPRLVRVTHRNIQANTDSIIAYLDLTSSERILSVLQFFYCFGTSLLHTHLRAGGSVVMATSFVYPEVVLNMMEEHACTGFAGVPSTYQTLLRNSTFPRRAMKDMRKLQQAGGKLQSVLIQELASTLPQAQVFVMYGQTEATARLSYLPPELLSTKLGSIGKGIPGVALTVIGEDGALVTPGNVGEIYASGDNISPGYWNDPEASKDKFVDGVLHTGDLATVDEDGFIFVVDRKADFIKSFGYRVSSQRVEECIVELPDVVGAAVIGEPDLVRGEAIWAFVVQRTGAQLTAADIINHCGSRLANYMVPKEVVFLDSLPMNAHGKIVKNELRKLASQNSPDSTSL
jgi:acyl-CoA synthetase (AMP-forming)/AMP-acid ligase II